MKNVHLLVILLLGSVPSFAAESYRELYTKPSATNASNINGGSSETRLFQRTNGNWNSSTKVFTATGDTLDASWVGHLACVCTDGTTTGAYFAEVTAIDNTAKTITLSSTRTLGSAPGTSTTARTITIGGAWTGMSGATTFPFSISTWPSVTNANGYRVRLNFCGSFSMSGAVTNNATGVVFEGYTSTPGDGGLASIDYTGTSSISAITVGGGGGVCEVRSLWFTNNSSSATPDTNTCGLRVTSSTGVGSCTISHCRFSDCVGPGLTVLSSTSVNRVFIRNCEFYDCCQSVSVSVLELSGDTQGEISGCVFHDNAGSSTGCINMANGYVSVLACVFDSNAIAFDDANSISPVNCVFYNNATAFKVSPGTSRFGVHAYGCIFENNTTAVSRGNGTADRQPIFDNCVFYNNTTKYDSNATGRVFEVNCTDATRSCLVDPANGDFRTRESSLRGSINAAPPQSSSYYSKTMSLRRTPGIEPSNPFYRLAP